MTLPRNEGEKGGTDNDHYWLRAHLFRQYRLVALTVSFWDEGQGYKVAIIGVV